MYRGTTPTHTFKTSISLVGAVVLFITYKQKYGIALQKTIDDVEITDEVVSVHLTQQDTLAFKAEAPVSIQIRARLADGTAVACNIINTNANLILKDGEI